ncbi:polysaccharide pyruvyl transferase family protein [Rhodococcus wratislaviensis]|uniref:polysaccharide pyruvyl transferase family protein n=1 Tax=Rhodococcus wratislaviensis TaxID=44752 RepID=UPI000F565479|nr:polysaccharide pyruvyl transferase family protein [Rhodococcus wratislaviensis]
MRVEVVHWNPPRRRARGLVGHLLPKLPPPNNFGDLLGPIIVAEILNRSECEISLEGPTRRLLTVGSIIRLARTGDVVWGSGVNGKSLNARFDFDSLDVRAVRGPLTRDFLVDRGIDVPEVYGDPGLLVGRLWGRELAASGYPRREVTVVPNLNDFGLYERTSNVLHPGSPISECLARIAASDFVTGSSLHAVVLAESWGIPARLVSSPHEPQFKYADYYSGTGRDGFSAARSVREAIVLGGEPAPVWDADSLLASFPFDLWSEGG